VTRVSRSAAVSRTATGGAASSPRVRLRPGVQAAWLASALLFFSAVLPACFNPTHIGEVVPKENHVPVVEAFPPPTFEPLPAQVGGACVPLELQIQALDDADGDKVTVRFDIVLERNELASRVLLRESPPIVPLDDGTYPLTDLTSLVLGGDVLGAKLGDLEAQKGRTQLVELRVSDAGFASDENGDPVPDGDGGVVFLSWLIALQDCAPVTP
jgi:hypothetical protein